MLRRSLILLACNLEWIHEGGEMNQRMRESNRTCSAEGMEWSRDEKTAPVPQSRTQEQAPGLANPPSHKKIAVVQSNYIPWKGYFDLMNSVDEFILYDDMQFTRRDWRNRNKIKTPKGASWLTIPVTNKGKYEQKIRETVVSDSAWAMRHWKTIRLFYAKAPYFSEYQKLLEDLYLGCAETLLSLINYRFISAVCNLLGIRTRITWSMDYPLVEGKTERVVHLCRQAGASEYISGPSARDYIDASLFAREN